MRSELETKETAARSTDFDAFYRAQWEPMVRFATLTTGSIGLAEEVVQDAFIDVLRRWDRVEQPTGYLRAAVASRCTGWVRRRQIQRRIPHPVPLEQTDSRLVELLDALKVLTPRQRAAIVLRYLDDLPESEIAEALSCRPGTVKSLLARGRTQLQEALES